MGSGSGKLKMASFNPINQEPVWRNVEVTKAAPIAAKGMIFEAAWQWLAGSQQVQNSDQFSQILPSLGRQLDVAPIPSRRRETQHYLRMSFIISSTLAKVLTLPESNSFIARRVASFGVLTSNGNLCSSAMRSINKRMASEMDRPIASSAAPARFFVFESIRALTTESAVTEFSLNCSYIVATIEERVKYFGSHGRKPIRLALRAHIVRVEVEQDGSRPVTYQLGVFIHFRGRISSTRRFCVRPTNVSCRQIDGKAGTSKTLSGLQHLVSIALTPTL